MAEALFERAAAGRHEARSAGSDPAERVHPEAVTAMQELGVDLGERRPRRLDEADLAWADVVVTIGRGGVCPHLPVRTLEWDVRDPAGLPPGAVRAVRDELAARVEALVAEA
jgi:arsenate reductase